LVLVEFEADLGDWKVFGGETVWGDEDSHCRIVRKTRRETRVEGRVA
jgi:hypothetical protein